MTANDIFSLMAVIFESSFVEGVKMNMKHRDKISQPVEELRKVGEIEKKRFYRKRKEESQERNELLYIQDISLP